VGGTLTIEVLGGGIQAIRLVAAQGAAVAVGRPTTTAAHNASTDDLVMIY
jgi:hypothetical protein